MCVSCQCSSLSLPLLPPSKKKNSMENQPPLQSFNPQRISKKQKQEKMKSSSSQVSPSLLSSRRPPSPQHMNRLQVRNPGARGAAGHSDAWRLPSCCVCGNPHLAVPWTSPSWGADSSPPPKCVGDGLGLSAPLYHLCYRLQTSRGIESPRWSVTDPVALEGKGRRGSTFWVYRERTKRVLRGLTLRGRPSVAARVSHHLFGFAAR